MRGHCCRTPSSPSHNCEEYQLRKSLKTKKHHKETLKQQEKPPNSMVQQHIWIKKQASDARSWIESAKSNSQTNASKIMDNMPEEGKKTKVPALHVRMVEWEEENSHTKMQQDYATEQEQIMITIHKCIECMERCHKRKECGHEISRLRNQKGFFLPSKHINESNKDSMVIIQNTDPHFLSGYTISELH